MIKLLAFDLDDTLLNDNKEIDLETVDYLNELKEKGMLVFFASARGYYTIIDYVKQVSPTGYVYNGGSTIVIDDKIVYESFIDIDKSKALFKDIMAIKSINNIMFETKEHIYSLKPINNEVIKIDENFDVSYPFYKITYFIDKLEDGNAVLEKYSDKLSIVKYRDAFAFRISEYDGTKNEAIKKLMKHYNLKEDEIMTFGDDLNDLEMISTFVGVAMKNAKKEVKEKAKFITDETNNNQGVMRFLKKMLK